MKWESQAEVKVKKAAKKLIFKEADEWVYIGDTDTTINIIDSIVPLILPLKPTNHIHKVISQDTWKAVNILQSTHEVTITS